MPLNIKKQAENLVDLALEYNGETINLKYRANRITGDFLRGPESEAEFCAAVIAEWDITADGEPFPPSLENLQAVEFGLPVFLCAAIVADVKKSAIQRLRP